MKKILLLVLLLFPFLVDASSMYQEIDILENGDLRVRESIAIDGEYSGFRLTLSYKYFDENKIYSADSLEVIKICESNKNNPIEDVGSCFEKVSSASKGDSLKYTQSKEGNDDVFMLYNPSNRRKAFYIEYILKNVVVKHNDINELRLNMIDSSFEENLDVVNIKVNLPKEAQDLRAWAHGPLWGNIYLDENKKYVTFTIDEYDASTAVDIRVTFDKNMINTEKVTNIDKLDSIIEEETLLADEANREREEAQKEYEEMLKKQEEVRKRKIKTSTILSIIWLIPAIFIFINYYKKHDKEYKSTFTGKYFRDFPSKHSPEYVEYLISKNVTSTAYSASILNIIYKKGFLVEKTQREKGIIRKKLVDEYVFILNNKALKEKLTPEEEMLRSSLISMFGINDRISLQDIKNVGNSESASREFINEYNKWVNTVKKNAIKENFFEDTLSKKTIAILYACIPFILVFMYIEYNPLVIILAILSIILIIYLCISKKRTKEGNELYRKWMALKNFIKDFGNFEEKELPDIKLWEKYLVYAHIFGIADELRKQMEIKMPNVEEYYNGLSMHDYMVLNHIINTNVTTTVNAAISSAQSKIAESNASSGSGGGGGFSGGGFSGGGFSGGGGSGGGRF